MKGFVAIVVIIGNSFLLSPLAYSVPTFEKKPGINLNGLTAVEEIVTFSKSPSDGVQIKLSKSKGYQAKFKTSESFQLLVLGLEPNVVAAIVLVSPKGLSTNLTPTTVDDAGILTLPYMNISKKGIYSILVRQPDKKRSVYIKLNIYR